MSATRRAFLQTGMLSAAFIGSSVRLGFADDAAKPLRIGILIPGSRASTLR